MEANNPLGTDGFEFIEFTAPEPLVLTEHFSHLGFSLIAKHRNKNVSLYRQGDINFVVNAEPNSPASAFAQAHGDSVCAMAFRVKDAAYAYKQALRTGAEAYPTQINAGELDIPAIKGIGDSAIYFVDKYGDDDIYSHDFEFLVAEKKQMGEGLTYIDHLTHNVERGNMNQWASFYERIFNFREIRFFDIKGEETGLLSRAMTSPCGKIRIPINESTDDKSQIAEYLREYNGEGIQHIALGTDDIYSSVEGLIQQGIQFLDVPNTYFDAIESRIPWHSEDVARLQKSKILIDGEADSKEGLLLQIFTLNMLGPVFFEIIQRKGNQGFGEGNFQALFEAIERDQKRRGAI